MGMKKVDKEIESIYNIPLSIVANVLVIALIVFIIYAIIV
jgi:hypothetical protein